MRVFVVGLGTLRAVRECVGSLPPNRASPVRAFGIVLKTSGAVRQRVGLGGQPLLCPYMRSQRDETPPRLPCGRSPVWRPDPQPPTAARRVPRTIATARMGEAVFGGNDLHTHAPLATFRDRPRPHAWAKPCLAATTYTLTHRSQRSETDHDRTHGRSPVWRADPRCSYERSVARRTPRVAAGLGWSFLITP
jgi:hypothetical protein